MRHQLELPLTRRNTKRYPCLSTQYPDTSRIIPGLDAELCRCQHCLKHGGVWWVDVDQRDDCLNKRKHKHPYLIEVYRRQSVGVDHDQETKQTKAQAAKRENQEWHGQKMNKSTATTEATLWS